MLLQVNPNRMELLRLRKRLALAQRGHKLLQDKLEQMMRRFMSLLKDIDDAKDDFKTKMQNILQNLLYCRITSAKPDFEDTLSKINLNLAMEAYYIRIMNVKVWQFNIKDLTINARYDLFKTSAQMDLVIAEAQDYMRSLLKLAQLLGALEILSYEIERTRRRVNALEYLLIPSILGTIRDISQKLNELERANSVRLMRVKEIIQGH